MSDVPEHDLLSEISGNIGRWYSYYDINLQYYREDRSFLFIQQWDANDRNEFKRLQKPLLTFNKLYDYFRKIVGEQRENTPNLEVRSLTGKATQDAINLRADLIRSIAFNSNSDVVYQTAFEHALSGGFGAFRIITEYESGNSFNQIIKLKRVDNPERCFFDPTAVDPTKSDGEFCGYYDVMSRKEFKQQYPDIKYPESFPAQSQIKDFSWGTKDTITIAEYYKKEWYSFTLYKLADGSHMRASEYKKLPEGEKQEIIAKRKSRDYRIKYYKAIFGEIIHESTFPGKHFPIVFVVGDSQMIEGDERTLSIIRFAKDAQRFLNYLGIEIAQAVKNGRREQFIGTPDNVQGEAIARMWKNPSRQQGLLLAHPDTKTGALPQRLPPTEVPQTYLLQYERADRDIQSILGYFEANRGAQGQELSGVALSKRQSAGNRSVFVFFDNLRRGIEQAGRAIMSLIPHIYDSTRVITLTDQNGEQKNITVNENIAGLNGQPAVSNDLSGDDYDVVAEAGPSFAVQRQEALEMLVKLSSINQEVFPIVADLIADNMDIENRVQLVERLKNLVPPQILAKEEGKPMPTQPDPQAMAAAQAQQQAIQLEQQNMQLKQAELSLKKQQQQIDAAKAEIEMQKLMMQQQLTGVKASAELKKAQLNHNADVASAMAKMAAAKQTAMKDKIDLFNDLNRR